MNFLFAWRYFKSKKTTNAINIIAWVSVIAIAVVTAAIIIVLSVFNGFEGLVKGMYTDFYSDIKISSKSSKTFICTKNIISEIDKLSQIDKYSFVVEERAVLFNEGYQTIVTLKGVDSNYSKVSNLQQYIKRGNYFLGTKEDPNLIVGAGIENAVAIQSENALQSLLIYLPNRGRTTSITSLESFNSYKIRPVGTFLIQQEFDNIYCFTNLAFIQYMLDMNANENTAIEIKLKENLNADFVKTELIKKLPNNLKIETRYEQNASLFKIMQLLNAIGANKNQIQSIFLCEGLLISFIGGLIGIFLAILICFLQQKFHLIKLQGGTFLVDYYPVDMQIFDFFLVSITIIFVSTIAAYFPSKKAANSKILLKN